MGDELRHIDQRLDKIERGVDALRGEVQDALLLQARHDEQIRTMQKTGGGAIGVLVLLIGGWLKQRLGL